MDETRGLYVLWLFVYIKTLTYRLFTFCICGFLRWEEEYTMRMDLQQKIADLQEVRLRR